MAARRVYPVSLLSTTPFNGYIRFWKSMTIYEDFILQYWKSSWNQVAMSVHEIWR